MGLSEQRQATGFICLICPDFIQQHALTPLHSADIVSEDVSARLLKASTNTIPPARTARNRWSNCSILVAVLRARLCRPHRLGVCLSLYTIFRRTFPSHVLPR